MKVDAKLAPTEVKPRSDCFAGCNNPVDTKVDAGSRRALLAAGVLAAAAVFTSDKATAQGVGAGHDPTSDWVDPILRLLRRITCNPRADEISLARTMGYTGFLEYQLNRLGDDTALNAYLAANYPFLAMPANEAYYTFRPNDSMTQLIAATTYRALFSRNQLYERMVEFWTYHFNIHVNLGDVLLPVDNRDVIRANALGKFPDLVKASMHSAAMMVYLNNNTSTIPIPNQNYARELMELHTLGVDGGYTQTDVEEVSRCLTGWSYDPENFTFLYRPTWHDNGIKKVLGVTIPANGGQADGDKVHKILTTHPSCAKFISMKMLKWLLRYDPSQSQINDVAAVFTATGGDIKAMIRVILQQSWLMAAPAKFKRPFHLGMSAIRSVNANLGTTAAERVRATTAVVARLDPSGMPLFGWGTPDGYPDTAEYWGTGLLPRWDFVNQLSGGAITGVSVDTEGQFRGDGTVDGIVSQINNRIFMGEMSAGVKAEIKAFLNLKKPINANWLKTAVGLALAAPEFQWY